jgi:hypothetical protein
MVARPKVPFSSAYSSPPGRKNPRSIRRIAAARTGPGQAAAFQVPADDLADARQGSPEGPDPVVLVLILLLTPQVVVAVLAASGRVGADGLDVALRVDDEAHSRRVADLTVYLRQHYPGRGSRRPGAPRPARRARSRPHEHATLGP